MCGKNNQCHIVIGLLLVYVFIPLLAWSQQKPDSLSNEVSVKVLPLVFFTPETRWAAGAASVATWQSDSVSRPSQSQLGFAYTQNKQWLFYLPFQLFLKKNKYLVSW